MPGAERKLGAAKGVALSLSKALGSEANEASSIGAQRLEGLYSSGAHSIKASLASMQQHAALLRHGWPMARCPNQLWQLIACLSAMNTGTLCLMFLKASLLPAAGPFSAFRFMGADKAAPEVGPAQPSPLMPPNLAYSGRDDTRPMTAGLLIWVINALFMHCTLTQLSLKGQRAAVPTPCASLHQACFPRAALVPYPGTWCRQAPVGTGPADANGACGTHSGRPAKRARAPAVPSPDLAPLPPALAPQAPAVASPPTAVAPAAPAAPGARGSSPETGVARRLAKRRFIVEDSEDDGTPRLPAVAPRPQAVFGGLSESEDGDAGAEPASPPRAVDVQWANGATGRGLIAFCPRWG